MRVDFQGDTLTAIERDGKVWVSVRRLSEAFGLDSEGQNQKLQKDQYFKATTCKMQGVGKNGLRREQWFLATEAIPLWVATISSGDASPQIQAKLLAYKLECAEVLERHFFAKQKELTEVIPLAICPPQNEAEVRDELCKNS